MRQSLRRSSRLTVDVLKLRSAPLRDDRVKVQEPLRLQVRNHLATRAFAYERRCSPICAVYLEVRFL